MVDVLFFADLQETAGKEKITIDANGKTVKELKMQLLEMYTGLTILPHVVTAVNEEYSGEDTVLQNGDVVAFIPPVSGG